MECWRKIAVKIQSQFKSWSGWERLTAQICADFRLPAIELRLKFLRKSLLGEYGITYINLNKSAVTETVVHELAHHLEQHRWEHNETGYFEIIRVHKMIPSGRDDGYFVAADELTDCKIKRGTSHNKLFKECYEDICEFLRLKI
jgi:hypothetical protein